MIEDLLIPIDFLFLITPGKTRIKRRGNNEILVRGLWNTRNLLIEDLQDNHLLIIWWILGWASREKRWKKKEKFDRSQIKNTWAIIWTSLLSLSFSLLIEAHLIKNKTLITEGLFLQNLFLNLRWFIFHF